MKPFLIGVTGTIGSGKSAVGNILTKLNVAVVDTDHIVHQLLGDPLVAPYIPEPSHAVNQNDTTPLLNDRLAISKALAKAFGKQVLKTDGSVDRAMLSTIVFGDTQKRKALESIIHPAVLAEMNRQIHHLSNHPIVAVLVPLLFEANLSNLFDEIWTVSVSEPERITRLMARDHTSVEAIQRRIAAQLPQSEKEKLSSYTIDNSGSLNHTEQLVKNRLQYLRSQTVGH